MIFQTVSKIIDKLQLTIYNANENHFQ